MASAQAPAAASDDNGGNRRQSDIIVTGRSLATEEVTSPLPVQILAGDELAHRRQGGLGETLAGMPGVHLDNFGGGASRPVIRGQTVPRIEVLTDGANLFDVSSVSPDHAITTDPLLLDAIEVQRGPAAVRYGGNAVNGAINLIDSKVPKALPTGGLTGASEVRYGTGDEEKTIVGRVTAGIGQFAIHAEGSRRNAGDYNVPKAYGTNELRDSFAESTSWSVGASWITDKGYIGAAYSRMESEYGLPGHSHANGVCHTHYYWDYFDLHCRAHGDYVDPITSPDDHTAMIKLRSDRIDLRADYDDLLPGFSHVRLRGSYTDYTHDEIDGPTLFSRYTNEAWDGRVELTHKPLLGFVGTLGVQYTDATFTGLYSNDLAVPFPESGMGFDGVPEYGTENLGIFLSESRSMGPVDFEIAARKDWRKIRATPPPFRSTLSDEDAAYYIENWGPDYVDFFEENELYNFYYQNPPLKHDPFSASFGATWNVEGGYAVALSLAHTERAPTVRELYAAGNNLATNSYEIGLAAPPSILGLPGIPDPAGDVLEKNNSINLTFRKVGGPLEFELGLYHQDIDNYIFARLLDTDNETGVVHNWLIYTTADARFTGIDGQVSYRFSPQSRVTVFGDYVDAKLKSEDDKLPRLPPGRLGARYEHSAGPFSGDMEYYHTFAQDKFASYETRTDSYDMLNATLSYRLDIEEGKSVEFYVRGTNLLNELAFAHTSFVKDQSPLRGRSVAFGMRHSF